MPTTNFVFEYNKKKITHPQTIELEQENRIIVIWTNAGGKTISLKTVGCAINATIWNVNPCSRALRNLLFDRILTDIGEPINENHLSTYSYRLKNMNYFEEC
jgi:DNA mismatch repair protein MutS2